MTHDRRKYINVRFRTGTNQTLTAKIELPQKKDLVLDITRSTTMTYKRWWMNVGRYVLLASFDHWHGVCAVLGGYPERIRTMKIGLLWFDPAHGVGEAVTAAANRYFSKYGVFADTVHVNPATIAQGEGAIAVIDVPVEIISDHRILPGHYWIGNRDADKMPERIDVATA